MSMIDAVLAVRAAVPSYQASIARRRALLIDDVARRYGVTLYQHPREASVAVVSATDYEVLRSCVTNDRGLDAVGRGYYSYLGGELDVIVAPDWTCDLSVVALLRARVVLVERPTRKIVRSLARLLAL